MGNPDGIAHVAREAALWVVPLLAAVILHELSHGVVALKLGDDTAQRMGRLTLNPLPHIDPIGTVLLPAFLLLVGAPFLFGYARPVPVDYRRLRNPKRDMMLVALAGPLTNLGLAIVSAGVLHRLVGHASAMPDGATGGIVAPLAWIALYSVVINVVLAVFNLLPIPPLDGGRVLTGILPLRYARLVARVEPFGFMIVILLLMTDALNVVLHVPVRLLLGVLL
jgi:Zn-dependent protease